MRTTGRSVSGKGLRAAMATVVATSLVASVYGMLFGNPISASAAPKPAAPPTPTITSGPSGTVTSTTATFQFTDSMSGVAFQCSLDGGAYSSCTSPKIYSGLSETAHTFAVRATTGSSDPSSAATWSWTVQDQTPPAAPTITKDPDDSSDRSKASFKLTDAEVNVRFVCSLGDSISEPPYAPCDKNVKYSGLSPDEYCFRAKAKDAAGNLSPKTEFCFANFEKKTFGISGSLTQFFYPGAPAQSIDLTLSNPNNSAIKILSSTVIVASATKRNGLPNPGCNGTSNLVVVKGLTASPTIPPNSTKTLSQLGVPSAQWPSIQMPNLSTNQDACKNTTFTINYSGTAAKV